MYQRRFVSVADEELRVTITIHRCHTGSYRTRGSVKASVEALPPKKLARLTRFTSCGWVAGVVLLSPFVYTANVVFTTSTSRFAPTAMSVSGGWQPQEAPVPLELAWFVPFVFITRRLAEANGSALDVALAVPRAGPSAGCCFMYR